MMTDMDKDLLLREIEASYETLLGLLQTQRQALDSGDWLKLASLAPQIRCCSEKISQITAQINQLEPEQRINLKERLEELRNQVHANIEAWTQHLKTLEENRSRLQSARRFARATRENIDKINRVSYSA
jgi:hypothetical protein